MYRYVHMHTGTRGGQKRALHPQELELPAAVSHPKWVLGTELESFAKAVCAIYHQSTSPVPALLFNTQ